jgi:hypothetical protein
MLFLASTARTAAEPRPDSRISSWSVSGLTQEVAVARSLTRAASRSWAARRRRSILSALSSPSFLSWPWATSSASASFAYFLDWRSVLQ